MTQEMIQIPKAEYERLKSRVQILEKIEWKIVGEFKEALTDLKAGKFIEC